MAQESIKNRLLEAFFEMGDQFRSGQDLANSIGCSRTAIWKHIEELREEGFDVESIKKKGYRLLQSPQALNVNKINDFLDTKRMGQKITCLDTIDSTQKLALQLAENGASEGTIVLAEEQTAGRGRMARKWYSPKYTTISMSMLIRPDLPLSRAPQFTLIAAVAVALAIEEVTNLSPEIKWPNDLLINGKKVTGILTELQAEGNQIRSMIIGIGINVNQKKSEMDPQINQPATSLFIESERSISRDYLVAMILHNFEKFYDLYVQEGFNPIKLIWESYSVSIGKTVKAKTSKGDIIGKALGITKEGVLQLEDSDGMIHSIYSADIEIT
jgi:BirA family biotin operon repressor/biotin-[acetyl-CoA-carboxylase] ligase